MSEIKQPQWIIPATPPGSNSEPAIVGGASFLRLHISAASPVDADIPALRADMLRNVSARTKSDKSLATWRRYKAERSAAQIRRAEAEASLAALKVKRETALEDGHEDLNLAERLVDLDHEIAAAEGVIRKAGDGIALIDKPIASATEAVRTVVQQAAHLATRDVITALTARRQEIVDRLLRQNEDILSELSVVCQRLYAVAETPQIASITHLFMAGE